MTTYEYLQLDWVSRRVSPQTGGWITQQVVEVMLPGQPIHEVLLAEKPDDGQWRVIATLVTVLSEYGALGWELVSANVIASRLAMHDSVAERIRHLMRRPLATG